MKQEFRKSRGQRSLGWLGLGFGFFFFVVGVYWLLTEGVLWVLIMPIGFMFLSGSLFLDLVLTRLQVHKERLVWVTPFGEKVWQVVGNQILGDFGGDQEHDVFVAEGRVANNDLCAPV